MEVLRYTDTQSKPSYQLLENEVFEHSTLGNMVFHRLKRGGKSLEASTSTGKRYKIGINLGKNWTVIGMAKVEVVKTDVDKLTPGCLFAIHDERKRCATMYRFVERGRTGKIKCTNPFDETMLWTVDESFQVKLIENF